MQCPWRLPAWFLCTLFLYAYQSASRTISSAKLAGKDGIYLPIRLLGSAGGRVLAAPASALCGWQGGILSRYLSLSLG